MTSKHLAQGLLVLALTLVPTPALARSIDVAVAKAEVIDLPQGVTQVSITDDSIADVVLANRTCLLVNGKKPGSTTLIVWVKGKRLKYDVNVRSGSVDLSRLRVMLGKVLGETDSSGVKLDAVGERVVLMGRVPKPSQVDAAAKVAGGFAQNVVNLLASETPPQVGVDVQVVEMRRARGNETGIDWGSLRITPTGDAVFMGQLMTFAETAASSTMTFRQFDRLAAQLHLLVSEGHARVLAKPNLVTVSGGKASFLVGGQIPIPQIQQLGQVTVSWRDYGVKLDVEPLVREDGRIALKVKPEVSSLDYNNAVRVGGFTIPSLSTRQAETQVILRPGESLAIGGLIQETETQNVDKLPLLGDIPILGALFSSTQFQKDETELAILVTPRLAESEPAGGTP